jgi:translation initiation factor 2A
MSSFLKPSAASTASSLSNSKAPEVDLLSLPLNTLLIREKNGIKLFQGPVIHENGQTTMNPASISLSSVPSSLRIPPIYDSTGKLLCLVPEGRNEKLSLFNAVTNEKLQEFDIIDAQKVEFSPCSIYLITWSPPVKGSEGSTAVGNHRIWKISTGELLASYSQKTYRSELIQWSLPEDSFCFRQVSNELHIYSSANSLSPSSITGKLHHQGFTQYKVAKIEGQEKFHIAVFNPEAGGKPSRVSVYLMSYSYENSGAGAKEGKEASLSSSFVPTITIESTPFVTRTIFGASEAYLSWNKSGMSLLIHSSSDVDNSNASYYGAMGLYLIHTKKVGATHEPLAIKVEQTKEGPVHAAMWSPSESDKFILCAGNMPCQSTMCNERGEPIFQFGSAHRNTICWSLHGRFVALGGFGNLAGEIDFYDLVRLKKLGSNTSHCATTFQWSPDSRSFMTATLAPRMNVDNGFKIFKYNGVGPIYEYQVSSNETTTNNKAFDCFWKPVPIDTYPNRGPSPLRRGATDGDSEKATASAVVPQKAAAPVVSAYRPPGSTGSLSDFMKQSTASTAPVGKVKKDEPVKEKFVPTMQQKQRVIPGMAPQQPQKPQQKKPANPSPAASSAAISTPVSALKPLCPPPVVSNKGTQPVKPAASATPAASLPPPVVETAESKEKKSKAIAKKLKQIEEIKAKVSSGQAVEPEQVSILSFLLSLFSCLICCF